MQHLAILRATLKWRGTHDFNKNFWISLGLSVIFQNSEADTISNVFGEKQTNKQLNNGEICPWNIYFVPLSLH